MWSAQYGDTAIGSLALSSNTTGADNTAQGYQALFNNTTGFFNVAIGWNAGEYLQTGQRNVLVGYLAGSGLGAGDSFDIDIGNPGVTGDANVTRIGNLQAAAVR